MPRQQRLNLPGTLYHIIARGIERREIFRDDADREDFLARLGRALEKSRHQCHAWALMPNHFHLLIRSSDLPLSDLMRRLMTGYAGYFNRRHRRSGHLFQNRYKSILCQEDSYFLELVRYIHLNPVRAGWIKAMAELDQHPWTGHAVLMGAKERIWQETKEILSRFSSARARAVELYQNFVIDGWNMGPRPDLMGGGLRRSAGGWERVRELQHANAAWQGDARILGDGEFVSNILRVAEDRLSRTEELRRAGWTLDKVIQRACDVARIRPEQVRRKGRSNAISKAKGLAAFWAVQELGIKGRDVSRRLMISPQAASKWVDKGREIAEVEAIKLLN